MKATITVFVEPKSLMIFINVLKKLEPLPLYNDFSFQPKDLIFKEEMISNWIWVNIPIDEYLKLKYRVNQLSLSKTN